ncbi:cell division ATP-binding protein FtsE [Pectinatus brassicae]|uniref:Cell division ATP-binding protein FtsE n=1 Tax=Pectinatus brassicae TaxID=862415 RepID=A0A840UD08_9FIRM|nr:cell division ATP-binding protein FtsE [Pectinatus brassicae]MBB5335611.1 cell division transport system ATP-binding protein [Pectinatus brassicae]
MNSPHEINVIKMKDVSKVYDNGAVALDNINISIKRGEFVFIVGTSGAGKSSFIKLLLREITPTAGTVTINGYNIKNMDNHDIPYLRRSLGVIFQDYRLLPNKTVYENVAFAMRVIESPRRLILRSVNSVLDVVGLREKYKCFPNQLSGGEQQRVAIARAIVNNPAIVIADEPTGNLDPETSWEIMDIFQRINAAGTTIVMATHDKTIVDTMQKRVIAIENGHIVRDESIGGYGYEI